MNSTAMAAYANPSDFCGNFRREMKTLYTLALLLTAAPEKAERVFLSALDDCLAGTRVFADWVRSWSRRAVIKSAIRTIGPAPAMASGPRQERPAQSPLRVSAPVEAVLQLSPFDRFVLVMSVFEGYGDLECAALLQCDQREMVRARSRALQALGEQDRASARLAAGSPDRDAVRTASVA